MTDRTSDRDDSPDERLRCTLEKALRAAAGATGSDEPDWAPLERVLPSAECAGFMFMGYSDDPAGIRLYKHGITRRYLSLDERCRAYGYTRTGYREMPVAQAVETVFEGLDGASATRETPYDDDFRARREADLRRAGYREITIRLDSARDGDP